MFEALNLAVNVNVIERNGNANENITNGTCDDNNGAFDDNNGTFDDNNGTFDDINGTFDDNNGAFDGCNEIFDDNCESDSNYFRDACDNSEGFYDYDFSNDHCNGLQSSGVNCSYAAVARKPITVPKYISENLFFLLYIRIFV